jgi:hypothetical protein
MRTARKEDNSMATKNYFMDTFIKIIRVIFVISLIACFLGRAIYIGISGGPLPNAIGEGLVFSIFMTLTAGVVCSIIWIVLSAFIKETGTAKEKITTANDGCRYG